MLLIFLVLGIGADDIFVYTDAWRQSADEFSSDDPRALRHARTHYALSRTAKAVFNTSFTTTVAFLSQIGSELMPIRSLGIYASIVIILNYIFAITFTPVVVLIAEDYFHSCCWKRATANPHATASPDKSVDTEKGAIEMSTAKTREDRSDTPPEHRAENSQARSDSMASVTHRNLAIEDESKALSTVDRLLQQYYVGPFLHRVDIAGKPFKLVSFLCMVLTLAYAIQGIYFAFQLSPPNEQEQWFPDAHMWTGFTDDTRDTYLTQSDDSYVSVDVVYGIDGIDRAGFDFWEPGKNLGTPEYAIAEYLWQHYSDSETVFPPGSMTISFCTRPRHKRRCLTRVTPSAHTRARTLAAMHPRWPGLTRWSVFWRPSPTG
jgi:hypothetical protein